MKIKTFLGKLSIVILIIRLVILLDSNLSAMRNG